MKRSIRKKLTWFRRRVWQVYAITITLVAGLAVVRYYQVSKDLRVYTEYLQLKITERQLDMEALAYEQYVAPWGEFTNPSQPRGRTKRHR